MSAAPVSLERPARAADYSYIGFNDEIIRFWWREMRMEGSSGKMLQLQVMHGAVMWRWEERSHTLHPTRDCVTTTYRAWLATLIL